MIGSKMGHLKVMERGLNKQNGTVFSELSESGYQGDGGLVAFNE